MPAALAPSKAKKKNRRAARIASLGQASCPSLPTRRRIAKRKKNLPAAVERDRPTNRNRRAIPFMPSGRPANPSRNLARDAGEKTYSDDANACFCGGVTRYTSNAQCVECAIAKGKIRYAALNGRALATLKAKDHARYERRVLRSKEPRRRNRPRRDPLDP